MAFDMRRALLSPRRSAAYAAAACIGLIWVVPFVLGVAQRPMLFFHAEWVAAALGILACAYGFMARRLAWTIPAAALVLLALAMFSALQPALLDLPYAEPSYAYAAYFMWAAFLVVLGRALTDELGASRLFDLLATFALVGGVLGACTGLVQKYGGPVWIETLCATPVRTGEIWGNIRHRSYFADHIVLGLVAGLHLVATGKLRARWLLLVAVPIIPAMALASSRGTLLCLLLLLAVLSWQAWQRLARATSVLGVLLFCLAGYSLMPWLLPVLEPYARIVPVGELPDVFGRMGDQEDVAGLGIRLTLWRHALEGILATPWLGVGPDGFAWRYYTHSVIANTLPYTIHSHNLHLQMALSFGVIAATVFTLWMVLWLKSAWQRLWTPGYLFLTGSLLVIGQRALLDLPLWIAPFLGITAFLTGCGEVRGIVLRAPLESRGSRFVRWGWGLCLVLGAGTLLHTMQSYVHAASLWTEKQSARVLTERYRKARTNIFLTPVIDSVAADAMQFSSRSAARTLSLNSRVMRWRPYPRVVYRQSAFLALNGRWQQACELLERAATVYPHHLEWFRQQLAGSDGKGQALTRLARVVARLEARESAQCQD